MREGDVVRRKTLLREVYREIRLWPKMGRKPWTRKVLVAANVEALTRFFVVSPTGHASSAILTRVYLLLHACARLRFRSVSKWQVKSGG